MGNGGRRWEIFNARSGQNKMFTLAFLLSLYADIPAPKKPQIYVGSFGCQEAVASLFFFASSYVRGRV